MIFTVEVDFTDRTIDINGFVVSTHTVEVMAESDDEAFCIAAQIVACSLSDGMVVATRLIEVII